MDQSIFNENEESPFECLKCNKRVDVPVSGTKHRNHCPFCLWSKDVDTHPGDRSSQCEGAMQPVALAVRNLTKNKYSKRESGEICLVHQCLTCNKISINRIAGDDDPQKISELLTLPHSDLKSELPNNIKLLGKKDAELVKTAIWGYSK